MFSSVFLLDDCCRDFSESPLSPPDAPHRSTSSQGSATPPVQPRSTVLKHNHNKNTNNDNNNYNTNNNKDIRSPSNAVMKQINNHINTIDPTAINALHSESNIANDDNDNDDDDSSAEILDLRRSDDGAARAFIGIIFFFF